MKAKTILSGLQKRECPECGGCGLVADPARIGERLRQCREQHGLSAREVASRMGYSAMYICDLEHGRRGWKHALVQEYLDAISK